MAIYESTPSSSVLDQLFASVVPTRHRIRVTSQMDSLASSSSMSTTNLQLNRATIGWSACVGLSLLLLQYIGTRQERQKAEREGSDSSVVSIGSEAANLYQFVYDQLTRLRNFVLSSRDGEDYDEAEDFDGESFVVHQGSCHCGSIAFEVSAPLVLQVDEAAGKLLYPSVRVPESSFALLQGEEEWQSYQVPDEASPATRAFSFCRKCAVHLVHAIDSDPFMVSFNVHCLTTPWTKASKSAPNSSRSAFRRVKPKKRTVASRSPVQRAATGGISPTPMQLQTGSLGDDISFESRLTVSPTPEENKPAETVVARGPSPPFLSREDSLSVASDNYSLSGGENPRRVGSWAEEEEPNPFALRPKAPGYNTSLSVSDWPTDTTDASSYLYADDESTFGGSVMSAQTEPIPGMSRKAGAAIASNYASREKLRRYMSKHMKAQKSS